MSASATDALEAGRLLFAKECVFARGITDLRDVPPTTFNELAFVGRSNAGKSSLLNALTGRKSLARTSNTPGRTKQINFFELGGALMLADLPGYGFARVSRAEANRWSELIFGYLRARAPLRRALVLLDARRGVMTNDREVMTLLDKAAVSYQLVLTKTDQLKASGLAAVVAAVEAEGKRHAAAHPVVMATSSLSGAGIPELRAELAAFAR